MANKTALVTGASSGIGLEFARQLAQSGYNLVLVARSEGKLRELATELQSKHRVQATVLAKDLTQLNAPQEIFDALKDTPIEVLVNNAGFAAFGHFATETKLEDELQMMQVNIMALTLLSKLFVKPMVERRSGQIVNVASTASFQPGPLMAVYYASKAYVLSFSEALARELDGTGVTVTALCPGPTKSGFQKRADMEDSKLVTTLARFMMSAAEVVQAGIQGMKQGKTIVVPGLFNKTGVLLPRFVPRGMATRIIMNMQSRAGH